MFLATVAMLFAAFTSAYLVRQGGHDWRRIDLPPTLWFSTAVLAASSIALECGRRSGALGRWRAAAISMAASFSLGAGFLVLQAVASQSLMAAGVYLPSSPHSSFFYMMTGAHSAHVVAALIVLLWGATQTWNGTGRRDLRRWRAAMSTCRTFSHFLLGVWVYLFLLLAFV
jgi:cytochrome c oxidase subunit 3